MSESTPNTINYHRIAYDAAPHAILLISPEGTILDANALCREFLGIDPIRLVGKNVLGYLDTPGIETLR